jgi:hypothetical protein
MPHLLHGLRGTVQGVLAASRHVLWYVDWQTGGAGAGRSGIAKG